MRNARSFVLEEFCCAGQPHVMTGDVVLQVVTEPNGRVLVEPPGNVLVVKTRRDGVRRITIVFLERPARRRMRLARFAKRVGCTQKVLRHDHTIRDAGLVRRILQAWG